MSKIAMILPDGFSETEALLPLEFLRRANIEVITLGLNQTTVCSLHQVYLQADALLSQVKAEDFDVVFLPGGSKGVQNLAQHKAVGTFVTAMAQQNKLIAAICAAPSYVLLPLGLLKGKQFTCHPSTHDYAAEYSGGTLITDQPVVIDEQLITSQGPGTAAHFVHAIITHMCSYDFAQNLMQKSVFS